MKAAMPEMFNSSDHVRALLQYHVLLDTHPSQSFSNTSQLVPTLLQNASYCNVTGGQRVELLKKDGEPVLLSAIKAESRLTHPDVFFKGGLVHLIDTVLTIPVSFPETITKSKLTNLVALLNKGNWLNPNSVAYRLALETPDLTIFAPDDPAYGAEFQGWNGLSQDELDHIFVYHTIPQVLYSTNFTNDTAFATLANLSVTARRYTSGNATAMFIDQAKITRSNYLTSNGVFQIINRPLDPNSTLIPPSRAEINAALGIASSSGSIGLTTAAIVGIVIGTIAILLALGLVLALRRKMKKKRNGQRLSGVVSSSTYRQAPPDYHSSQNQRNTFIDPGRVNASLPATPRSVAGSLLSMRGRIMRSRPPAGNFVELEGNKDMSVHVSEMDASDHAGSKHPSQLGDSERGAGTRPPRTPPELDGRARRHSSPRSVSITFHGEPPRHIGFEARY